MINLRHYSLEDLYKLQDSIDKEIRLRTIPRSFYDGIYLNPRPRQPSLKEAIEELRYPPEQEYRNIILITNLSPDVTFRDLYPIISDFIRAKEVKIIEDPEYGNYAYVLPDTAEGAERLIRLLNGYRLYGKNMVAQHLRS
jgi:RNA recognition motif-containing protein